MIRRCFLALLLFMLPSASLADPQHVTILHFNDIHGHLEPVEAKGGERCGAARIATIVHRIEDENGAKGAETILLFGGDALTGTLISLEFKGDAEFDFFNDIGVDAMTIGNHDFDEGLPRLEALIQKAQFPVLSANIRWKKSGELLTRPWTVISGRGPEVAVVGLATIETRTTTAPQNIAELDVTGPAKEAQGEMKKLPKNVPLRIALAHMGQKEGADVAQKVRGLSAVIGGHDHSARPEENCRMVKKVPVCLTPPNGCYVGRLDFEVDGNKVRFEGSRLLSAGASVPKDKAVAKLVDGYSRRLSGKYDRVIGKATKNLKVSKAEQTPLGRLICDAIRWKTGVEIGFINSSGVRAPLKRGIIKVRDVVEMLPFKNTITILRMKGSEIADVGAQGSKRGAGFIQISGADDLEKDRTYSVGTVDFLADGGDGFEMLKGIEDRKSSDILLRDVVMDYIKKRRTIP
ncbi:MAG: 5'-nucleotidase C-terminal domain-containing protein [Pseudomonadota bacterium]